MADNKRAKSNGQGNKRAKAKERPSVYLTLALPKGLYAKIKYIADRMDLTDQDIIRWGTSIFANSSIPATEKMPSTI